MNVNVFNILNANFLLINLKYHVHSCYVGRECWSQFKLIDHSILCSCKQTFSYKKHLFSSNCLFLSISFKDLCLCFSESTIYNTFFLNTFKWLFNLWGSKKGKSYWIFFSFFFFLLNFIKYKVQLKILGLSEDLKLNGIFSNSIYFLQYL